MKSKVLGFLLIYGGAALSLVRIGLLAGAEINRAVTYLEAVSVCLIGVGLAIFNVIMVNKK